jgi:hypothetical protein
MSQPKNSRVAEVRSPQSNSTRGTAHEEQAAGGSLKEAQAQLGHTKLSTTLELYTLPVPDHQRAAVKNLARMVTNGDEREPSVEELPPATQQIQ